MKPRKEGKGCRMFPCGLGGVSRHVGCVSQSEYPPRCPSSAQSLTSAAVHVSHHPLMVAQARAIEAPCATHHRLPVCGRHESTGGKLSGKYEAKDCLFQVLVSAAATSYDQVLFGRVDNLDRHGSDGKKETVTKKRFFMQRCLLLRTGQPPPSAALLDPCSRHAKPDFFTGDHWHIFGRAFPTRL